MHLGDRILRYSLDCRKDKAFRQYAFEHVYSGHSVV
jgi:hypothetical protein